jgi:hypothetical protein
MKAVQGQAFREALDELVRLGVLKARDDDHPDGSDYFISNFGRALQAALSGLESKSMSLDDVLRLLARDGETFVSIHFRRGQYVRSA